MSENNEQNPQNPWVADDDHHQTEPIVPFAPPTEEPAPAPATVDWQQRYEKEHSRSRIFMVATGLVGALAVGSLVYASAAATDQQQVAQLRPGIGGQAGPGGHMDGDDYGMEGRGFGGPGSGGPGMGGGMGPGGLAGVSGFFNSDGSVNETAVTAFKEHMATEETDAEVQRHESQLSAAIDQAVTAGTITQKQADELSDAVGLGGTASGGTTDSTAT